MGIDEIPVLVVLAPFLLLPLVGWLGSRGAESARLLALIPAALSAYFVRAFVTVASTGPFTVELPWAPSLGLSLAFHFDGLSLLFANLITGIGVLIVLYAVSYLDGHPLIGRFLVTLFAFMGSMLGVVLSDNVLLLFVFWELTGFTSYFLIAFDHERKEARRAALQALLVTGTGGLALLAVGVAISQVTGTTSLSALRAAGTTFVGHPAYGVLAGLILLAAFTKSAQFPFHFWLPNAMEAPTPVSGYLHSATMVKAGLYLVARMTPLFGGTPFWTGLIATAGALTMIGSAYRSLLETDLKRILAYTTLSALGAIMLMLSVGTVVASGAALVYLAAHACYKGALFLVAGAIDHETGTRDARKLTGLGGVMPRTALAGVLAAVSMAGVPPLFGFIAKEGFYTSLMGFRLFPYAPTPILVLAVGASVMMGAAALTAGLSPFLGKRTEFGDPHEPPTFLWLAPLVLAAAGLLIGLVPGALETSIALAVAPIVGEVAPIGLALWHGFTPVLLLSAITLVLSLLLYRIRRATRNGPFVHAPGTERMYDGILDGLDGLSRLIAPALQSASLRAYVRVILVTAVGLVVTAFVVSGELPEIHRGSPIRAHEAGIALLIMVAAVATALAKTAMAAVLSMGAVGYGVALIYVLFGAPDLAATQFAIETLTVVIFVLVFYQFSGFDDELTWMRRLRDALIAGAVGTTITLLVLIAAGEGSPSRLAAYFLDAAPRIAHGQNVVNVILVDFRAFDTMGEITVLVTVAIGVRALLQIGKERT